ncbi:hypothetical protein Salat_2568700 [Sesamum alatum]|uniref:Uncharacterized protein n=1 Tax=Sesamum alatum TaxID=300844 RepID=A0AAE1XSZ3_9LAMI|nr:hypothetical protein Salat_2568700 [Sesamum alatum]
MSRCVSLPFFNCGWGIYSQIRTDGPYPVASHDIFCLIFPRFSRIFGDPIGFVVLRHELVKSLNTRPILYEATAVLFEPVLVITRIVTRAAFRSYFYEVIPNTSSQNGTRPFLTPRRKLFA